ncbi:phosphatase and actin regulator 4-B [Biomphalaria pfeifferi]|uniref:Phosphatase and actin regulator 4-B n=1 Tax=Biomphalaria pfeifferi TaxID=112525 RepID=A0AAD8B8Y5_BIOPF|nr:phosphatase and actin regulator 4-B [Biomphalaria pfeifferi]
MPIRGPCPHAVGDIPWKWFSDKKWREKTFRNQLNHAKLAEDGFLYIESENTIMCYYCNLCMSPSDNVEQAHRLKSPECTGLSTSLARESSPQAQRIPPTSSQIVPPTLVSDDVDSYHYAVSRPHPSVIEPHCPHQPINQPFPQISQLNPPVNQPHSPVNELLTSVSPPLPQVNPPPPPVNPPLPQVNPPLHPVSELVTSVSPPLLPVNPPLPPISELITSVSPVNPPLPPVNQSEPHRESPLTGNENNHLFPENNQRRDQRPPNYTELGIITERPKRNEYVLTVERLRSFDNWPRDHHIKVNDLVEAGFYYAGFGDCARCFYCGGGLRNWDDQDDVFVEHARWFPKCGFIRQFMGQVFVDTVQELMKTESVISYAMVADKIKRAPTNFPEKSETSQNAAVKAVIEQGYDKNVVLEAAKHLKENKKTISADQIIDYLLERNIDVSLTCSDRYPSDFVETCIQNLDEVKKVNTDLRQQTVCKICMDKEVALVFLPCGHFVCCVECSQPLKNCPLCRSLIKGSVRAFLS